MGAQGLATVNFGAWPGSAEVEHDVTGQSGFTSSSIAEAWVYPVATADHSVEEHVFTKIKVSARYKVNGTFTINVMSDDPPPVKDSTDRFAQLHHDYNEPVLTTRQLLYGQWTIAWVWN